MDLSFAPSPWKKIMVRDNNKKIHVKHFEMCVMTQLRDKLRTSDVYVRGADAYGDYRQTLLPWEECLPHLAPFCEAANIANNAKDLVAELKTKLTDKITALDAEYPNIKDFEIKDDGTPTIKQSARKEKRSVKLLLKAIKERMPERTFLDVMGLTQNCTEWANCFSLLSGSDQKLDDPIAANIVTAFGYGTGMGPADTARHVRGGFTEKTIGNVNKRHVSLKKLNAALARLVDYYSDFPLVKIWGDGNRYRLKSQAHI